MSGSNWSPSDTHNTGTRPGIYINFIGSAADAVQTGAQGVVAVPATADWGLLNGITIVTAESELADNFGTAGNAKLLASQALRGGASEVKVYRMGSGSAAKATLTLNGTDAASAITLTAIYEGARANAFTVKVAVNSGNSALKDLSIIESGSILEVFTHADNDELVSQISGLETGINPSRYVTAILEGAADRTLANTAGSLMSGGNSGTTVTSTEHDLARASLETVSWNLIIPSDSTSTSIWASYRTYIDRLRAEGKKVQMVVGGQSVYGMSSSSFDTEFTAQKANAVSTTTGNHQGVVNVFPGIVDELSGDALTGAQTAARVAGMIAKAGYNKSITRQVTGAADVTYRLTQTQIKQGLQAGLVLITTAGNNIVTESGINTLTSFTTTEPRTFRKIRFIRTIDAISQTIAQACDNFVIGAVNNDANGQSYVTSLVLEALGIFQQAGAIKNDYTAQPNVALNNTADPDEWFLDLGITPIDSMEKIFLTAKVL